MGVVLEFPMHRRRGRPPVDRPKVDRGTPELQYARSKGETSEMLDLLLQRRRISAGEHWCGIHLRWLHVLRHGTTGARAKLPEVLQNQQRKINDPAWLKERNQEYVEAATLVGHFGMAKLIALCVHNQSPQTINDLYHIQDSLKMLAKHWVVRDLEAP